MDWNLLETPKEKEEEKLDWTTIKSPKVEPKQPMGSQFGGNWGLSDLVKQGEEKPPIEEGFKLEQAPEEKKTFFSEISKVFKAEPTKQLAKAQVSYNICLLYTSPSPRD